MQIITRKRGVHAVLALALLLAAIVLMYFKRSYDQAGLAKWVSSLRQVHAWTVEYENLKREDSSNLKDIIKYFTTLHPTDEYKSLISALESGDLVYKPHPIPGEPMIRWKKKNSTIELMPDGNVRSFAK